MRAGKMRLSTSIELNTRFIEAPPRNMDIHCGRSTPVTCRALLAPAGSRIGVPEKTGSATTAVNGSPLRATRCSNLRKSDADLRAGNDVLAGLRVRRGRREQGEHRRGAKSCEILH